MANTPEIHIPAPLDCFAVFSTSDINQMELECMAPYLMGDEVNAETDINIIRGISSFAELIKRRIEGKAEYRVFSLLPDGSIHE